MKFSNLSKLCGFLGNLFNDINCIKKNSGLIMYLIVKWRLGHTQGLFWVLCSSLKIPDGFQGLPLGLTIQIGVNDMQEKYLYPYVKSSALVW